MAREQGDQWYSGHKRARKRLASGGPTLAHTSATPRSFPVWYADLADLSLGRLVRYCGKSEGAVLPPNSQPAHSDSISFFMGVSIQNSPLSCTIVTHHRRRNKGRGRERPSRLLAADLINILAPTAISRSLTIIHGLIGR